MATGEKKENKEIKIDLKELTDTNVNRLIVMLLKDKGYRNRQISDITGLSHAVVKQHVKRFKDSHNIEVPAHPYVLDIINTLLKADALPSKTGWVLTGIVSITLKNEKEDRMKKRQEELLSLQKLH